MIKQTAQFVVLLLAGVLAATSWVAAQETREFNFSGFTEVSVGSGMNLDITQGQNYRVSVRAEPAELERLRVDKRGNALQFRMESDRSWRRRGRVDVSITMPRLTGLDLSGGAQARVTMDVPSERFSAGLSGGAELKGQLHSGNLEMNLSGGSEVTLEGSGSDLNLVGSGGSEANLRGFSVRNLDADLSGGSRAAVTMEGQVEGNLSGGSEITYYGNATLGSTDLSGGSAIRKGR
jgi:hypothetical protein